MEKYYRQKQDLEVEKGQPEIEKIGKQEEIWLKRPELSRSHAHGGHTQDIFNGKREKSLNFGNLLYSCPQSLKEVGLCGFWIWA